MRPWVLPALSVGWLAGVGIGSVAVLPPNILVLATVVCGAYLILASSHWRVRLVVLACFAGVFGIWRANGALQYDEAQRALWDPLYGRPRVFRGVVVEAEPRGPLARLTVGSLASDGRTLPGFLRATGPGGPRLTERAHVVIRGFLERPEELRRADALGLKSPTNRAAIRRDGPEPSAHGDLKRTLTRLQVFGAIRFPVIRVTEEGRPPLLTTVRLRLRDVLLRALPEPAAGLYSAFLLSFDSDLDRALRENAAATGLLHLVAISGSHIAVIAAFVFAAATLLGLSSRLATAATLGLTAVFLFLVGLPESGVRSGLMAGLVGAAFVLGRQAAGLRALLFASVGMTVVHPRILLGDPGFQLSALAVWGLLALFPLFMHITRRVPDPFYFKTLFLLTIAAEVATLPVTAYTFGRFSLVAPFTNMLAVPLFPALLAAGAIVLTLGLVFPALAALPAALAAGLGNAFLGIAELGRRVPFHEISLPPFPFAAFAAVVLSVIVVVHALNARVSSRLRVWSP